MDYGYMPFKYSLFYGKSVQNGINDTRVFGWQEGISDPYGRNATEQLHFLW